MSIGSIVHRLLVPWPVPGRRSRERVTERGPQDYHPSVATDDGRSTSASPGRGLAGLTPSGRAIVPLAWSIYDFANTIFSFVVVSGAIGLWLVCGAPGLTDAVGTPGRLKAPHERVPPQ